MIRRETKTFGFCCGLGGGAKGFKKAASRIGNMIAALEVHRRHRRGHGRCA